MIIKTNTNISDDKTSYKYCEKYSLFTKQELEDFAQTNGLYTRTGQQWGSKNYYLCMDSKIVYTEAGIEIAVATTKAYLSQIIVLLLMAIKDTNYEEKAIN